MSRYQMDARPHPDGALRWVVTSRSRPEIEHLVELDGFGGVGRCSCEHFEFRIAPDLREGRRVGAHRCSHILAARNAFTDAMIQALLQAKAKATDKSPCEYCGSPAEQGVVCDDCREQIQFSDED
jgi:hypothetical protein